MMKPVDDKAFLAGCLDRYRITLLDDIVPFWLHKGIDRQHGGLSNVMDDAGNLLNNDKYIWSQGRALWTFAALYNRIEKREEWLAAARHIFAFLDPAMRDDKGRWPYRLDENGAVQEGSISIYVDGFVMNGMTEYYRATGDPAALDCAVQTCENILGRINTPGSYGVAPYEIPAGMKTHGIAMIFSFFMYELSRIPECGRFKNDALKLAREILDHFYQPDRDAVLEFVAQDGSFVDEPIGRACVPGHVLEAMWFLITIFEAEGDTEGIRTCCRHIKRHLELGWDDEFGGISLGLDIDGKEPVYWQKHDCKPWWVQVEAMVATLHAYKHAGEDWCLEWHRKVRDYAFGHYPVATGEWTQWLDRQGNKAGSAALPVKDPFHLPRGLIYMIRLIDGM